ncbi:cytosolic phospholipase A2 zeta [Colletotrichum graminicola]|uniref:Lysophospholipase n=1 Tax=Colletotrichum graminicola (strain M1.001 / M2 / FGSC 10212) TaxID=645133 RepID=E3QMK1_COLGM|nr:cytosolic phospholipase A2 zeta [Colletotrichum graminicola M1.001]EFQ32089.1 cytosolic phospholipase A2 zeta [Colletotrichum graminicola M1.001]WDK17022.1 cytosolic phospholipase A2 zeta [Colletotrichum graminicola]
MRLFALYSRDAMRRAGTIAFHHSVNVGRIRTHGLLVHRRPTLSRQSKHSFFTATEESSPPKKKTSLPVALLSGALFLWLLYPSEEFERLSLAQDERSNRVRDGQAGKATGGSNDGAWYNFALKFETLSDATDIQWSADKIVGFILPEWSRLIPGYIRKLQRELSMAPGSLADEIWREAHDPFANPEVQYGASVRVSNDLCDEEKEFLARRKRVTTMALAKYLDLDEKDVHPEDVPTIAMCGSGGGLRALVAGTGSMLAADEDGLFDCVTYTSGVSGSCWLQALYHSSISEGSMDRLLQHLKARAGIHIAYPPVAFQTLLSAPTNKSILSGLVEKLKGDPGADFGLVDIYGLLLAARYLVPKGELEVNDRDFKLSNQRDYIKYGQNPLPIYTAVRHEIPDVDLDGSGEVPSTSEAAKEVAKQEAWFQWFEITPYEFFCEEFQAGIPTWAMGRRFENGVDVPPEEGFHLPETRLPFLLGVFGSAFCATLSHYYNEVRPIVQSIAGFSSLDGMITGYNEDLSKVHPIDPGTVANFAYGMEDKLPDTVPKSVYKSEHIQLMDAGMSNNLPIYPLLRPGRDVDVVVAFDASADIKTDNWLAVADGYARQRGIKGWPVGVGWPKAGESSKQVRDELLEAEAASTQEADQKLYEAKEFQHEHHAGENQPNEDTQKGQASKFSPGDEESGELGYCTVWVGTTQERTSEPPPQSKAIDESTSWQLMEPDAGIAIIYLPYLANPKVPGINPGTTDFLSTWNFVYTPDQIEQVAALSRANYAEGREKIRGTVRAVYERKKKLRLEKIEKSRMDRYRRLVRQGMAHKLGEGDQFS